MAFKLEESPGEGEGKGRRRIDCNFFAMLWMKEVEKTLLLCVVSSFVCMLVPVLKGTEPDASRSRHVAGMCNLVLENAQHAREGHTLQKQRMDGSGHDETTTKGRSQIDCATRFQLGRSVTRDAYMYVLVCLSVVLSLDSLPSGA